MSSAHLTRVKHAAADRDRGDQDYRRAVEGARRAGHSLAEIAAAAGISRQAVSQLLNRHPTKERGG